MKLDTKALAITFALIWGGCIFLVALLNSTSSGYGQAFVDLMASVYPGFHPGGIGGAVVGGLYGAVDGAVCGVLLGWIYNTVATRAPVA